MRFFVFWGFIKMNILIVGNGFDLSHYLPTKYDHFMIAMGAIENWDASKGDMSFDDLFGALYEKEDYFFGYTKAMYKTDEIKISVDQIKDLKKQLEDNVWYQYFSDHVKEMKTWIDFETKIEEALEIVCDFMDEIEIYSNKNNSLEKIISFLEGGNAKDYFLSQKSIRVLGLLKILDVEYKNLGIDFSSEIVGFDGDWSHSFSSLAESFLAKYKGYDDFLYKNVTKFLYKALLNFSSIFCDYLKILDGLNTINNKLYVPVLETINRVYSFNYTSTFLKIYRSDVQSYFLHGKISDQNKIVLGVSDLNNQILRKFDLWGFTKYHQKLLLNTDYNFLEEFLLESKDIQLEVDLTQNFWLNRTTNGSGSVRYIRQKVERVLQERSLDINFYIWGHSLDYSDNAYVKELFSFNEPYDQGVKIVVYYYEGAQFDLLANLIYILKKDKVENWMKKGWLKFEKNPDIAKINDIEPIELSKMIAKAS